MLVLPEPFSGLLSCVTLSVNMLCANPSLPKINALKQPFICVQFFGIATEAELSLVCLLLLSAGIPHMALGVCWPNWGWLV